MFKQMLLFYHFAKVIKTLYKVLKTHFLSTISRGQEERWHFGTAENIPLAISTKNFTYFECNNLLDCR